MRRSSVRVVAGGLVVLLSVPAVAHHSRAGFDTTKEVTIAGIVTDVVWANPHVYFTIETRGDDATPRKQEIEVGPPSTLQPLGLTREALTRGELVSVRVNPSRRGPGHLVLGLEVTTANGEVFPLHVRSGGRAPPAAVPSTSLEGRWVPASSDFLRMVQSTQSWPLTEAGRAGLADGAGDTQVRCTPWPSPLLTLLPMLRTIEVHDDRVTIDFDWMGAARVIRLDLDEHPTSVEPTLQGHSIGRWDGDTLIIDSVGFTPHEEGAGFGIPSSADKRLVERLSLTPDRSRLTYEFTVEDPLSLTEAVTEKTEWVHRPDLEPTGQECDRELAERFLNER